MIRDEFGWQRGKINDVRSVMKKKIIFGLIAVGVVGFFLIARTSRTNLDNDPGYKPMIGKILRTRKDLVVIDFKGSKKSIALAIPGISGVPELKDIPEKLPFDFYGHEVYGVFPAGGTFQISHIELAKSFEFSFVDFYATVTSEGIFRDKRIDVGMMTNQKITIPTFDKEYVEEITPAK